MLGFTRVRRNQSVSRLESGAKCLMSLVGGRSTQPTYSHRAFHWARGPRPYEFLSFETWIWQFEPSRRELGFTSVRRNQSVSRLESGAKCLMSLVGVVQPNLRALYSAGLSRKKWWAMPTLRYGGISIALANRRPYRSHERQRTVGSAHPTTRLIEMGTLHIT